MVQHRCAEPDCQQPLGWEYHGPKNEFLTGAGRCTPEIELMVAQQKHDGESSDLVGKLGLISLLPFSILWGLTAHHAGDPWIGLHTISASLWFPAVALGMYLLAKKCSKDRPQEPRDQASQRARERNSLKPTRRGQGATTIRRAELRPHRVRVTTYSRGL